MIVFVCLFLMEFGTEEELRPLWGGAPKGALHNGESASAPPYNGGAHGYHQTSARPEISLTVSNLAKDIIRIGQICRSSHGRTKKDPFALYAVPYLCRVV